MHPLEYLLDHEPVLLVRGADEEVVGNLEQRHQGLEALGVAIGQLLRGHSLGGGGVGHRLAVLVGAGEKEHVLAALAHMPSDHVGRDRLVGVPQVRDTVDI